MKPSNFKEIKENFEKEQKRWESLKVGDIILDEQPRFFDYDYHEAEIKEINIEERYVIAYDRASSIDPNKEIRLSCFLTEEEFNNL